MASVNKAILVGSLGRDPEIRYMSSGEAVANFSIATSENWKDKNGQKQEKVEWHNIVAYSKLAEIIGEYLKKGSSVYVEGRIQTRKWEKDGVTRYSTEIVCNQMQMLSGKQEQSGYTSEAPTGSAQRQDSKPDEQKGSFDDFSDDVPW